MLWRSGYNGGVKAKFVHILWPVLVAFIVMIGAAPSAQAGGFGVAWQLKGQSGWAEHPIIYNGVAYVPWNDGKLSAIDVASGKLLHELKLVNYATAPFIANNHLYSYWVTGMNEITLDTFEISRQIPIENVWYTENVPYDEETGYFFVRQAIDGQYKGRVTAFRLSDGAAMWSYPNDYTGGFDNHQNALVVGDSLFFQSTNSGWQGSSMLYRLDKRTGQVIWAKTLSSIAVDSTSRGGYNNPIYDADHDVLYVSESWNSLKARVYAFQRSDGKLLWSKDLPGRAIESTLSYYANQLYLPLHVFSGHGSYMAVSAMDGKTLWAEPGFYNEDGWSATGVDAHYLYHVTHGSGLPYLIVQDRLTGKLVWSKAIDASADCFNPVLTAGMVIMGSTSSVFALQVGDGLPVNSDFHGVNASGYNPGAISWDLIERVFLPFLYK